MYAFIEIRTDDERYIISSLIDQYKNEPDKLWTGLQINHKKEEQEELAYWDNPAYLKDVLFPNLKRYSQGAISRKQFLKRLDANNFDEVETRKLISSEKEARELLALFSWAEKLKMI